MPADIFAKLGDIKGESLDAKHKDEIEILSYSWGVSNAASGGATGGAAAGKASFQDLSFMHYIDRATPFLLKACASGTHLKEATIVSRKAGKTPFEYLVVKLSDVIVTSVMQSASTGQPDTGSESVSLSFAKVQLDYRGQKADGTPLEIPPFKYDLKANKIE